MATSPSFANWSGPQEVVVGIWGADLGQFYFASGDTIDSFPREFGVDKNGFIVIPDGGNKRIVIYNEDGTVKSTLAKPAELPDLDNIKKWPLGFILYSGGNNFVVNCNYQKTSSGRGPINICFMNYAGTVLSKIDIGLIFSIETGFVAYKNNNYSLYSPTGQLIKTSTTRPAELGVVKQYGVGGAYKIKVTYPDNIYQFTSPQPLVRYYRDSNKYLYQIEKYVTKDKIVSYRVHKYTLCGKEISVLALPLSQYEPMPDWAHDAPTWVPVPVMEYGEPLVSSAGDIYAWARTKTQYKILKWTWVDDPNVPSGPDAPTNLVVAASINGLYLTWTASPQDPGCVTGYEISRATSAGGVGTTVGTVNGGVLKYNDTSATAGTTYYYKVRAVSGTDYSPYTAEVTGKR